MPEFDLPFEQQSMLMDLVDLKLHSLQRDIVRADECGSLDYVEILHDELIKYRILKDSLSSFFSTEN